MRISAVIKDLFLCQRNKNRKKIGVASDKKILLAVFLWAPPVQKVLCGAGKRKLWSRSRTCARWGKGYGVSCSEDTVPTSHILKALKICAHIVIAQL
jgi:hypothetical protein